MTQMELSFFGTDPKKLSRKDSPQTSKDAGERVNTSRLEKLVYESIKKFGGMGCISDEILAMFPMYPYSSITARYSALLRKNLIEIKDGTRPGRSGKQQRIMVAK